MKKLPQIDGITVHCAHDSIVPVGDLKPYPRNNKTHPEEQISLMCKAIKAQGWRAAITVSNQSGYIVRGHGRLEAAKRLGLKAVPVDYQNYASTAAEQADRIADNKLAELAEWDLPALKEELLELDTGALDMDITGFDAGALETLMTQFHVPGDADAEPQIDKADELNKTWKVKPGDLYTIGDHRLLCGDSTKAADVARVMDGGMATCVFTDPPYGVSIGKKNAMLNTFQKAGRCLKDLNMDDMKPEELKVMLLAAFRAWRPHFADDCSVFVCSPQGGGLGMMMMMMMMQESCLEVRHIINWIKNSPTFSMGRLDYDYQHEPILFTWVKTHKRKKEGAFQTSLWTVDKPRACDKHPTMKPIELPTCAFLNHTDEGDVVVDLFGGSGTTLIAAENIKRKGRMIEISPAYCAVILQRMKDAFPDIKIKRAK